MVQNKLEKRNFEKCVLAAQLNFLYEKKYTNRPVGAKEKQGLLYPVSNKLLTLLKTILPTFSLEVDCVYEIFLKKVELMDKLCTAIFADDSLKLRGKPATKPWKKLLQVIIDECMGYTKDGRGCFDCQPVCMTTEAVCLSFGRKKKPGWDIM